MAVLQGSIQVWSQLAATWTGTNPVLLVGQFGYESDSLPASPKVKVGDGVTAWNALSYLGGISGVTWGSITGTLSNQIDLQTTFDLKAPLASPAFTGAVTTTGKTIILNKGGAAASGSDCGFIIEENNLLTGYFRANTSRDGFFMKAPGAASYVNLRQHLITITRNQTFQDVSDTFAYLGAADFTGTPTAPTAAPGTNTTQLATTAFVTAAITAATGGGYIKADGTIPLTANWAAGNFSITANSVILGSSANTIAGGAASGGNLRLYSTTHSIKGRLLFGTSGYDENQDFLGIGTPNPSYQVHLQKNTNGQIYFISENQSSGTNAIASIGAISSGGKVALLGITGGSYTSGAALYQAPNRAWLECNGSGGLLITCDVAAPLIIAIGGIGAANEAFRWDTNGDMVPFDGKNLIAGTTTGIKIGTATGQKLGFWNATPVVQQVLATGAGATVDNVITLLQTLGLCKQS